MEKLAIIGLGGAGYTAGIYAYRYNLNPLIIGESDGGLITESHDVQNFPGYPNPVSGYQIMDDMKAQLMRYNPKLKNDRVKEILPIDANDHSKGFNIKTFLSGEFQTKSLILAIGTQKAKLGIPGEKELFGKGVSYCATCDGFFYKNKKVAVIGGGNTALIEALYLSDIAEEVYLIHRRNTFRGEHFWENKLREKHNVKIITPSIVNYIGGTNKVQSINISATKDSDNFADAVSISHSDIAVDGVFVAVGTIPNKIDGIDELLHKDDYGYIKVDQHMQTNIPGVWAAGDISTGNAKFKQLIIACAEGALASEGAFAYISKLG